MATDYSSLFAAAGQKYDVHPQLLAAVAQTESAGNPDAVSPAGAMGLMQLMPQTAASLGVSNPYDPAQAIDGAARLLAQNLARFGNPDDALRAYNAGPNQTHWNNPETTAYVPKVAAAYAALSQPPADSPFETSGVSAPDAAPAPPKQYASSGQFMNDASPGPAPAPNTSPRNSIASMSPADFFAQTAGSASRAPASSAPAAPAGAASNPIAAMSPSAFFAATTAAPAGQAASSSGVIPTVTQGVSDLGSGLWQGLKMSAHSLAGAGNWIDNQVPALASLDARMGFTPDARAQVIAQNQAADQQYQTDNPGVMGSIGRIGGQMLATAPLVGAAGAGLGLAGNALVDAAGGTATALGRGLGAAGNLLSGTAAAPGTVVNPLIRGTSLALNGAAQGAAYGALGAGGSDQPIGSQIVNGALTGAVAGPVLGAALAGAGKVGSAVGAAVQPFFPAGRNAIADSVIARVAQGGPVAINNASLVPGSSPTLAQATANPGIAAVERAVSDVRPNPFIARAQDNAAARNVAVDAIRGDPQSLQNLIDVRTQQAQQQYGTTFANTSPVNPQPVLDTIDQILASPSGQRDAVTNALQNVRNKIEVQPAQPAGPNGQPATPAVLQTDPAQLYGVRQAITDMLSPMAQGTASNARLATSELGQVKSALDPVIEQGAPGYNQSVGDYAANSRPIDAMQFLQGLKLTDANGQMTMAKVKGALDNIATQQALPGPRDAKSIPPAAVAQLQAIYADLQRQSNTSLGKSIGSNTFQNLATNNALTAMGAPLNYGLSFLDKLPGANLLTSGIRRAYEGQNAPVLDALVNKLLDPSAGASAFRPAAAGGVGQNLLMGVRNYGPGVAATVNANRRP